MIFFAAYGESIVNSSVSTPLDFGKQTWSLTNLRLSQEEYKELVNIKTLSLKEIEKKLIWNATLGHVGLVVHTLDYLKPFKERNVLNLVQFLYSQRFLYSIISHRAFCTIDLDLLDNVFERKALFNKRFIPLIRSGILVVEMDDFEDFVTFSCPLIRAAVVLEKRSNSFSLETPDSVCQSLRDFVLFVLSKFRKSTLTNSFSSAANGGLIERKWQAEFYNIVRSLTLNEAIYIDPDVGHTFGCSGYLDFYINAEKQWGVEFLVDGKKVGSHADRFSEDGLYNEIPLKQKLLVDFIYSDDLQSSRYIVSDKIRLRVFYTSKYDKFRLMQTRKKESFLGTPNLFIETRFMLLVTMI
eukprot:Pompholyxophrys_punicea_v1_NODE_535_length_1734_cov_2.316260.p1 type:complete len:354 gc:universal NODE_535_length_1734_cov_2.316260:1149-88(-)